MKKLFIILFLSIFSNYCYSQDITITKANEIKSIGIMPVISSINILHSKKEEITKEERNRIEAIVNEDTQNMIDELMKKIELPNKQIPLDSLTLKNYISDFDIILKEVKKTNQYVITSYKSMIKRIVENFRMSDELSNIIKSNGERYALYVVNQGFTRTKISNSNRQLRNIALFTAGVAMAPLSGLGLVSNEYRTGVTSYVLIVDAETKKISRFVINSTITDPMDANLMKAKQLYPVFNNYWVWYHSEADKYMKLDRK